MTPLHTEHAAVVAISNRLYERDETAWRRLLAVAHRLDVTLLALIYSRLREVRDDVAREAFERRVSIGEIARERRAAMGVRNLFCARYHSPVGSSDFDSLQKSEKSQAVSVGKVDCK